MQIILRFAKLTQYASFLNRFYQIIFISFMKMKKTGRLTMMKEVGNGRTKSGKKRKWTKRHYFEKDLITTFIGRVTKEIPPNRMGLNGHFAISFVTPPYNSSKPKPQCRSISRRRHGYIFRSPIENGHNRGN